MSGTCDSGFVFYSCNNGFKGCCSVSACDSPDGCPDDAMQPEDTKPTSTTTSATEQATPSETTIFVDSSTTSETAEPSSTLTDSITTTTPTSTLDGSATSIEASTPSPTDTGASQSSDTEAGPALSTAAIAGICVGGTVFAMFILLIISLRIRRHRIAKRHASSADAGIHYSDAAFAEDFMKDHPSISAMRNSRADGGDLALFIPNSNS